METKVLNEYYNPVMKRKEIKVEVSHSSAGTPERFSTRKALAERFNAKLENLYVTDMITGTGTQETICNIEIYDDQEFASQIVPTYIRIRNLPADERKKLKEAKAEKKEAKPAAPEKAEKKPEKPAAPAKKEEKPAEKKAEVKPAGKPAEKPAEKTVEKKPEKKAEKKEAKKEEPKKAEAKK